ncbi:penicillin-binding protein activator [Parahaliea sp. F7430]|uniref:Penicillin-binding protein activator n=1 Tax=Sediminihaliea albiluteola TaxID=2758564 RepID=A0A7W2YIY0_9GAMM|nr:penicillin-binding protein activator [Sediminihaliea albiluteola]MBA6412971.1 penicillin-binding protein activator [Sediminihaliea albiluteola]
MSKYQSTLRYSSSQSLSKVLLIAMTLLVSSCSTEPTKPSGSSEGPLATEGGDVSELIGQPHSLPASDYAAVFERAEAALARFEWVAAEASLNTLSDALNSNDRVYRDYLRARIAYLRGQTAVATQLLQDLPKADTAPALSSKVLNFQRYMVRMAGDYLGSAELAQRLLDITPDPVTSTALKRSLWRDLEHLPAEALQSAGDTEDPIWRGWLELATISASTTDANSLHQAINQWRQDNAAHPAAKALPGGLEPFVDQALGVQRVALLLPLSGRLAPAAKAVRDGYLARFYADSEAILGQRQLLIFDTQSSEGGALAAYQEAVQRGANLVVGPLSKEAVSQLAAQPERPVPILALNRVDETLAPSSTALVQMALAPEDEAERLAELAYGAGARRALIVRPAGAWGDKMEAALRPYWQAMGGQINASAVYSKAESYSDSIKQSLNLAASEERARSIRSMLATNIESNARRRQDIDAIFLLSGSADEARSIKPLLVFHYAGNLPIYAPSSIYSGMPNERDRDLNGIHLVELPWLLGSNPALRVAITAGDTGSDSYPRLNALGADAYLVQSRFLQLQGGADALLRGDTGLLSMDPQLRIIREPQPATFDGGALKAL